MERETPRRKKSGWTARLHLRLLPMANWARSIKALVEIRVVVAKNENTRPVTLVMVADGSSNRGGLVCDVWSAARISRAQPRTRFAAWKLKPAICGAGDGVQTWLGTNLSQGAHCPHRPGPRRSGRGKVWAINGCRIFPARDRLASLRARWVS